MSPLEGFPQEQTDAPLRFRRSPAQPFRRRTVLAAPVLQGGTAPALSAMLRAAGSGPAELDLVLGPRCGHGGLQPAVHGLPRPHQCLIFSDRRADRRPEDEDVPVQLGSLVFSVDTLHRETLLYGQDPEEHCLRLLAHGLGHLAGYDHGPEMDELCSEMLSAAEAWLTAQ